MSLFVSLLCRLGFVLLKLNWAVSGLFDSDKVFSYQVIFLLSIPICHTLLQECAIFTSMAG